MKKQLTSGNQNTNLVLAKSKSLLDVTNKILTNRSSLLSDSVDFDIFIGFGHTRDVISSAIYTTPRKTNNIF